MSEAISEQFVITPLDKLHKDIKQAAATMSNREARFLVDFYYSRQHDRIRTEGQLRAIEKAEEKEPHATLDWVFAQAGGLENNIKNILGEFAKGRRVGAWAQSICGIGPVISAGLIAYCGSRIWVCMAAPEEKAKRRKIEEQCRPNKPCSEICHEERVNTASRLWRYAGLDPTVKWEKGQKRPWNAKLKVLAWKIGDSFMKQSSNEKDFYGQWYKWRKRLEIERNEAGQFAEQAQGVLRTKKIDKNTEAFQWYAGCYQTGVMTEWMQLDTQDKRSKLLKQAWHEPGTFTAKLPPAHIQARAQRWPVKLFLSHFHQVSYMDAFGELPPTPYVMQMLGHVDQIQVPNWPWPEKSQIFSPPPPRNWQQQQELDLSEDDGIEFEPLM